MTPKNLVKTLILTLSFLFVSFSFAGFKKHFTIDINKCTFDECDECVYECPEEIITETEIDGKTVLVIDAEKCTYCEICYEICPEDAIYRDSTDIAGYDPKKDPNFGLTKEEIQAKSKKKKKKKKK